MLAAKNNLDYWPEQEKTLPGKRAKPAARPLHGFVSSCLVILPLTVAIAIFLVARYTAIIEKNYVYAELQSELASLQNDNRRLALSIGQLESLERVEAVAVGKLGMVPAEQVRLVALDSRQTAQPSGPAVAAAAPKPPAGRLASAFSALYTVLAKTPRAEAGSRP